MSSWIRISTSVVLGVAIGCSLGGCTTSTPTTATAPANPQQAAINFTYSSYASLDQAILAADAAVKSGVLKGDDARRTLAAMTTAKTALDASLAALKASAMKESK